MLNRSGEMKRWKSHILIYSIIFLVIAFGALKVFYLGWFYRKEGENANYEIRSYRTLWSLGALFAWGDNDSAGGFYRIYDSRGRKVFEKFSTSFAFDIILLSDSAIELQLDEIYIWSPNEPLRTR